MPEEPCRRCGSIEVLVELVDPASGMQHHASAKCATCGKFKRWLPKPDADKKKRPAAHRDLVKKYSRGHCELCLRTEDELPSREQLEAHHVDEFCEGGDPGRENIWIVCTYCH